MNGRYFLDTNVFVYSFDPVETAKATRARELIDGATSSGIGVISTQVMQEFVSVALRKFSVPLSLQDCREYLRRVMWPLCRVTPDVELFDRALDVHGATGFSFYDSLIVAAAVQSSCATLLSEDLQSDRTIQGVRIQNPFVTA